MPKHRNASPRSFSVVRGSNGSITMVEFDVLMVLLLTMIKAESELNAQRMRFNFNSGGAYFGYMQII